MQVVNLNQDKVMNQPWWR